MICLNVPGTKQFFALATDARHLVGIVYTGPELLLIYRGAPCFNGQTAIFVGLNLAV